MPHVGEILRDMDQGRCVLVLRDDGRVLGAGALAEDVAPVVVRWIDDPQVMQQRVAIARDIPAVSRIVRKRQK